MHRGLDGDGKRFDVGMATGSVARGLHGQPADHRDKLRVARNRDFELEGAGVHATRRTG